MSKEKVSNLFFPNRYIYVFHLYIFFFIFIENINKALNEDINGVKAPFPNCIQLSNNKLLLANQAGIFVCNKDLQIENSYLYLFPYNSNLLDNIYLIQLEEDGYGISLINDTFYFIFPNGNIEKKGSLPQENRDYSFLNLVSYKKDNDGNFYFIASFIEEDFSKMHHYYYKIKENDFSLILKYNYRPHYNDYPNIKLNYKYFTCQIMYLKKMKKDLLTCCFGTRENNLIIIQSFDIENSLIEFEDYYSKIEIDSLKMITSAKCYDKENLLVCYSSDNLSVYCFHYNIDSNRIINKKLYIEKCLPRYSMYKSYYFKENMEFIFICQYNERFSLLKFDEKLELLNSENFKFNGYYEYNSLSLIYNKNEGGYEMVTDAISYNSEKSTKKFNLKKEIKKNKKGLSRQLQNQISNYWINSESNEIIFTSNLSTPLIIDFCNEINVVAKDNEDKPIDPSLYSIKIKLDSNVGNLTANINGEEKLIENEQKIPNICKINYYKELFTDKGYTFTFLFSFYNLTDHLISKESNYQIVVCKPNCTCEQSQYCKSCMDDYNYYGYGKKYCFHKNDLKKTYLSEQEGSYLDCYSKCKTCNKPGYNDFDMGCTSCDEETYYFSNGICNEIICDNLFYKDKITRKKTCINTTNCPEEYPILDNDTKECKQNNSQTEVYSQYTERMEQINYIDSSDFLNNNNSDIISVKTNKIKDFSDKIGINDSLDTQIISTFPETKNFSETIENTIFSKEIKSSIEHETSKNTFFSEEIESSIVHETPKNTTFLEEIKSSIAHETSKNIISSAQMEISEISEEIKNIFSEQITKTEFSEIITSDSKNTFLKEEIILTNSIKPVELTTLDESTEFSNIEKKSNKEIILELLKNIIFYLI